MSERVLVPPSVDTLNQLLDARRLGRRRLLASLALSYLGHAFLLLLVLYATRQAASAGLGRRAGINWGGPVVSVTALGGMPSLPPTPSRAAAPPPEANKPAASDSAPRWAPPKVERQGKRIRTTTKPPEPRATPRQAPVLPPPEPDVSPPPDAASSGGQGEADEGSAQSVDRGLRSVATSQGRLSVGMPGMGPGGGGGGGGGGLIDGWYVLRVRDIVYANWRNPFRRSQRLDAKLAVTVFFRIRSDGAVTHVEIERPSGFTEFDRAAMRAVREARLPPLPPSYPGRTLGVHYLFELEPEV